MSIDTVVAIFLALLVFGAIFGIMFAILWYIGTKYPSAQPWLNAVRVVLFVLGGIVLIFMLLDFAGHPVIDFHSRR